MDYTSSELRHSYRYQRVDAATMQPVSSVGCVRPGGALEYNDLTSLKVTGSVRYDGRLDLGNDYLRVWMDTEAPGGEGESIPLGTFIVAAPRVTLTPAATEGAADLYSLLLLLDGSGIREPLTVPAGANAVGCAAGMARDAGLDVSFEASAAALAVPRVYDAGTSRLEVINDLLKVAGYDSAEVDGMGTVVMRPYRDPTGLNPVVTIDDGARAVLTGEVAHELDILNVPNVVVAVVSNDSGHMVATAVNSTPANRYSTVSRGREVVELVELSDIHSQDALQAYAESVLASKTSAVESVELRHAFLPYGAGDTVRVSISAPDGASRLDFTGSVAKRSLTLDHTATVAARVRRFVRF